MHLKMRKRYVCVLSCYTDAKYGSWAIETVVWLKLFEMWVWRKNRQ